MRKMSIWGGVVDGFEEFEEKAIREEDNCYRLTGYAATWDSDKIRDVIVPGAFKKSIERLAADGETVPLYYNHKTEELPLGDVVKLSEDKKGLRYEAELTKGDLFVDTRIYPAIKRRVLKSNSFGFQTVQSSPRQGGGRILKELNLLEVSVVNNPCNRLANIEGIKGLIGFQDLAIDAKCSPWDAAAALTRVRAHFAGNADELKSAFLYVDEEKGADDWDARLLIADIVEGKLVANRAALYKANAALCGARGGVVLPEEAGDAVKDHIDRYFSRMSIESPVEKFSVAEYEALEDGEREARLKSFGLSQSLAKKLIAGQRDADRTTQRDVGSNVEAPELLNAMAAIMRGYASAIATKTPATGK